MESSTSLEQAAPPEVVYGVPATPFVATFVGIANLVHAEEREGVAMTRFGAVRLLRRGSMAAAVNRGLVVIRPEHLDVLEAPDGPADAGSWQVLRRRFTGTEILYEVAARDGERIWVEAGPAVRRLRLGDAVNLRLRDVETVMFPVGGLPASPGSVAQPSPAQVEPR